MAYLCVIVSLPSETINQINPQVVFPTKTREGIQGVINVLLAVDGGDKRSDNCYVVVRDTDPTVTTSGSNSTSTNYNKP